MCLIKQEAKGVEGVDFVIAYFSYLVRWLIGRWLSKQVSWSVDLSVTQLVSQLVSELVSQLVSQLVSSNGFILHVLADTNRILSTLISEE